MGNFGMVENLEEQTGRGEIGRWLGSRDHGESPAYHHYFVFFIYISGVKVWISNSFGSEGLRCTVLNPLPPGPIREWPTKKKKKKEKNGLKSPPQIRLVNAIISKSKDADRMLIKQDEIDREVQESGGWVIDYDLDRRGWFMSGDAGETPRVDRLRL